MENEKVLVLIPAYNEESRIGRVLEDIKKNLGTSEIVVINDGSSDKTAVVASQHGAKVLNIPYNLGYGAALQTGYLFAQQNNYDIVVQMDGDGQHDPACIKNLLDALGNEDVDMVIGSRYLRQNGYKTPWMRKAGMIIFGTIASLITRQRITDPTSGFQALKKNVVHFFTLDIYPPDYPDTDMLILLYLAGFRFKEIPVKMFTASPKQSMHRGHKIIYYIFKMFLSISVTLMRKNTTKKIKD